jgi:hypothetical protein
MADKNETLPARRTIHLERWLGRREAFGMIAGRCSAADVECLRQIRNQKLYLDVSLNWQEFCRGPLRSSRKKIDTAIRQLEDHGPQFFHATQVMRITEAEYIAIKEHITEEGVKIDGQVIEWSLDNTERITEAVGKLRAIAAPRPERRATGFDLLFERFDALNAQLEKMPVVIEDRHRRALGDLLLRLSNLAAKRGVVLVQR